jgi:hypothetical protein
MDREFLPLMHPSVEIPDCWSPETACEIADFLSDIVQAIWATHGTAMAHYLEPPGSSTVGPDDDMPF